MRARWARCCVGAFMLAAIVASASAEQAGAPTDRQVKEEVQRRFFDAGLMGVTLDVQDGTVTLGGSVGSLWLKERAVQQAQKVRGVRTVVSGLTVRRAESDAILARDIADDVSNSSGFTVFDDVSVHVAAGVATLEGFVTAADKSKEFTKLTSRVPGVQQIVNRIETLPALMMDDDLRMAIAMGIYGSPVFANYANLRTGPVHIIVRRGDVTLTGVVASEVERRTAEMIARGTFGAKRIDNRLRLDD